ncbi:MAG: hypothetical protein V4564_15980 [Pseudomonadota bacterium]|uniref:hypothetical protein n=1 Tax=Sphingomonas sp. ERG5 TaxID=1381597 RepID=UPI00054B4CF3|nr:hypothetical protein [Sphingomonas sp. ERG5]
MTDVDRQIARSTEYLDRTRERSAALSARRRKRQGTEIMTRLGRIAAADAVILIAAVVVGWIVPLGIGGAMLVMAALIAATLLFAIFPTVPEVKPETFGQTPLKLLPMKTEQWLESQRPALPAPAQTLVDGIGVRLEALTPQMVDLNEQEPAAAEVRKLIGEQLPELLKGYSRVPQALRGIERNGKTPDQQLADGLKVIDEQIAGMSAQLAEGDLNLLATRGRFLEIKYREDGLGS